MLNSISKSVLFILLARFSRLPVHLSFFIFLLASVQPLQAATTITQTFNQSESTLTDNFTQSIKGITLSPFTWSSTGGIGNTGKVAIPTGSDQIWTSKQKYSVVDNGVYQIKALFKTSGTGYGSLGLTFASQSDADGVFASPNEESIGVLFHGGAGNWINHETAGAAQNASDLIWANTANLGNLGTWYLFDLTIEDLAIADQFRLTLTIYNVDQSTGAVTSVFSGQPYTTTVTNSAIKNASDLYVFFGAQDNRMDSIDNFEITLSDNVIITGQQAGGNAKYALDFDGVDDFISIPDASGGDLDISNSITVETWFYSDDLTTSSGSQTIISNSNSTGTSASDVGYELRIGTDNKVRFRVGNGSTLYDSSRYLLEPGKWYHIAGYLNTATNKIGLIVNGIQTTELTGPSTIKSNISADVMLGSWQASADKDYINGKLDEIRIWNKARTLTEIQNNMNNELVGDEANLVAYYKLNDGAGGYAEDSQTNNAKNYGSLNGSVTWTKLGDKRLDFDGTGDYVEIGNNAGLYDFNAATDDFTVSYFINTTDSDGANYISHYNGGADPYSFSFRLNVDGTFRGSRWDGTNNPSLSSTTAINDGAWHHVAFVKRISTDRIYLYVDGVLEADTLDTTSGTLTSTTNLFFGKRADSTNDFIGSLAEVSIFNRDLNTTELAELYASKKLRANEAGLIGYWPLDGNDSNSVAYDKSAYQNNGTITGASPVTNTLDTVVIYTNEKTTSVYDFDTYNTIDNWGINYSITGGTDSALFAIDATTGKLTFNNVAASAEGSTYQVEVTTAASGEAIATTYTVNVIDASINTPPTLTTSTTINTSEGSADVTTAIQASDESITNSGITLDGVDDYVELANESAFDFTTAMSVEFWMKSDGFTKAWEALVTKGDDSWRMHRNGTDRTINFTLSDGTTLYQVISTTQVDDGKWHHIAGTFDGSQVKIYVDEVLEGTTTAAITLNNSAFNVAIGENLGATGRQFGGSMNDLRIWNKALIETEVTTGLNQELNGDEANLAAYYKFDETSGTDVLDSSPNHNNGTLTNATNDASTQTSNTLMYSLGSGNNEGSFSINSSSGVLTFNTTPDYETDSQLSYNVNVIASDGVLSDSQLYTINVTDYSGDSDGDGIQDEVEGIFAVPPTDTDNDGTPDHLDTDSDGDNILDINEGVADANSNGIPDYLDINLNTKGAGRTLDFDGSNDHIVLPNTIASNISNRNAFTIEYWYKGRNLQSPVRMQDSNFIVAGWGVGDPSFIISNDGGSGGGLTISSADVEDNRWHHVAMVWQRNTTDGFKVYLDGKLYASRDSADVNSPSIASGVYLGSLSGTFEFVTGQLDDVRIWTVARTANEITGNMAKSLAGDENGLLAYYNFDDESSTTLSDRSGNGFDGTLTNMEPASDWLESTAFNAWAGNSTDWNDAINWSLGSVPIAADNVGISVAANAPSVLFVSPPDPLNALSFDGVDDYVSLGGANIYLGSNFTQEVWIRPTDASVVYRNLTGTNTPVAGQNRAPYIYQYGAKLHFGFGNGTSDIGTITTTDVLTINEWNHVATSFDGTNYRLYVNGVEVMNFTGNAGNVPGVTNYVDSVGGSNNYFQGEIDEIRLWTVTRTLTDIRNNMNKVLAGDETGLEAYYQFNQSNIADPIIDAAGNGHIGTANNFGVSPYGVSGAFNNKIEMNNLIVASSASVNLNSPITVNGNLILNSDLNLNGQVVTLNGDAALVEGSGVVTGTSGSIVVSRILNNISALDIAGLGAEITTSANMGLTTITRTNLAADTPAGINRVYHISPTNNTGLNATLTFTFKDTELNGLNKDFLSLYKSTDGVTYVEQNASSLDMVNNTITLTGMDGFSYWTAAESTFDTDGDGVPNISDTDDDNDGVPDTQEVTDGTDPLNKIDYKDSDGDYVPDYVETNTDFTDPNNASDFIDNNADGIPDQVEADICIFEDFNGTGTLDSSWVTTPGSNFTPGIIDYSGEKRLQLTSTTYTASGQTVAGLWQIAGTGKDFPIPATLPLRIEFKAAAYGGTGADGMSVILSDYSVIPDLGGSGGELGYMGDATTGFLGGWMAIGISEYPSSFTINDEAVAIRGSIPDFPLVANTATLSTAVDGSGSGHGYRISFNPSTGTEAWTKVERDTGAGYTTIINSTDVLAAAGQAALPADFRLSFAAGTGGASNNHEITKLRVFAPGCASLYNSVSVNNTVATATTADFTVRVSNVVGAGETINVDYNTADGTALAGTEYTASSGTLIFVEGEQEKTISVALNDLTAAQDKQFYLQLNNQVGTGVTVYMGNANAVATIDVLDTDGDGIVNSQDLDDDNDGLSDADEAIYGTNPLVVDSDGDGISDGVEIANGSDPLNSAPVITQVSPLTVTMDEDGTPTAWSAPTLTATDPDADTLTWSLKTTAIHGTATVSGTGASPFTFNYVPAANYTGTDYFTVQVSDANDVDTITVKVVVNPVVDGAVSGFIPYTVGGMPVYDEEGSSDSTRNTAVQPALIDIASCSANGQSPGTKPSVMIAYRDTDKDYDTTDDAQLVMRMRLDANPSERSGSGLKSYHWDFLVDIDNDGSNDYIIDVEGNFKSNKLDRVVLYADTNHNFTIDAGEYIADWPVAGSKASASDKATSAVTITEDTSVSCGGSSDFWLDVSIPVDSFTSPAYNASVPIGAFYSSSASNTDPLQKDWMGSRDGTSDTFIGLGGGSIVPATGSITGTVYNDLNGDENYTVGNPDIALSIQTVTLLDANGNTVDSYSATASAYSLTGVEPGNYRIRNTNNGYGTTTLNVTVVANESTTLNIPTQGINKVSIHVFEDLDGDGQFDTGEPNINGSDIYLDGVDSGTDITANGFIQLTLNSAGRHVIKHNNWNAAYTSSSSTEIAINHQLGDNHAIDFGLIKLGEISGVVYIDKDGDTQKNGNEVTLAGATITVKNEADSVVGTPVVTGADGSYRFIGLSPNTKYYIEETNPAGYASTSSDQVPVSFGDGSAAVINFGDVPEGKVSGYVFSDDNGNSNKDGSEQGLARVTIIIFNNGNSDINVSGTVYASGDTITSVKTDVDGYYSLSLPPGRYRLEEQDPLNYVSVSSNIVNVTLPSSQTVKNFADMKQGVLTGMVFNDLNGNGQLDSGEPGVNSVVLNIDGSTPTTSTESDGSFYFGGMADGSYTLNTVVPTGFVSTTVISKAVTVDATTANIGLLFGIKISGSIAGEVYHDINGNGTRDTGEVGIGGVTIDLSGNAIATTTTLTNGSFSFSGLTANGTYTVTETDPTNYRSISSNTISVSLDADGKADVNASFADIFEGLVSGIVFEDLDGDGIQDTGDSGVTGNVVSLTGKTDVVTDNNGGYQFIRVSGDGLSLSTSVPSGYAVTTANNPTTIDMSSYSGGSNFGVQPGATVQAYVFEDANGNGVKDGTEEFMPGVAVSLSSGESGSTDSFGKVRLNDVVPGGNTVIVGAVSGYSNTTAGSLSIVTTATNISTVSFGKYINIAPWVLNEAISIAEDTAVSTSLLTLTSGDENEDTLSFSIVAGNTNNLFAVDSSTGEVSLNGALNYETLSSYSLTIQVEDVHGLSSTATITITITDVNEAPVANSQSIVTVEDIYKVITLSASDEDNDTLVISVVSSPSNGTLVGTVPSLTYIPNVNFNGTDSFTYKSNDGTFDSTIATVNILVTPLDDAPIAVDDTASVNEDSAVIINVLTNDSDAENNINPASLLIIAPPANGTLSVDSSTGAVTYTPNADYYGGDSFQYRVSDSTALVSNAAVVNIAVVTVNDAPVGVNDVVTTIEDTAITSLNLLANDTDADGDALNTSSVIEILAPSNAASYSIVNGILNYTPATNFVGTDSLQYTVADVNGGVSNTTTVTITVTGVNDAPVANNDSASVNEDASIDIDVIANDTDVEDTTVDATTVQIVQQPSKGSLSVNTTTGVVTYTPASNYAGTDSFTYQVMDTGITTPLEPAVYSNVATVSITVNAVNDAPVAVNDTVTMQEDDLLLEINVLGNDSDLDGTLDASSVSLVTPVTTGTLSVNGVTGRVTYTAPANYNGSQTFTYTVNDNQGQISNTATVTITINAVNDVPVADAQSVTTAEDTAKVITLTGSDLETPPITLFTVVSTPAHGTLTGTAPNLTYTPTSNYNGSDSFTFKVNDGTDDSAIVTVNITVTPVNDAPVAVADSVSVNEDSVVTISILSNDTDAENNISPATVVIITQPTQGTISVSPSSGAILYTPTANYNGSDSLQYQVSDSAGDSSNTATVNITVQPVNDGPLAVNDAITTNEDIAITPFNLLANDSDIDDGLNTGSVIITQAPAHALSYSVSNGVLSYTPATNYVGNDQLQYTVTDVSGVVSNVTTTFITVIGVNDPPIAVNDSATTNEDTAVNINVVANDTDVEDGTPNATTVQVIAYPANGSVSVNSTTGVVSYTPNADYNGSDSFTYMVKDAGNSSPVEPPLFSNQATVNITVTAVNDAPMAVNDNVTLLEDDQPLTISVLGNDRDSDGTLDLSSITIISGISNGLISVDNATGRVTYKPSANFNGSDSFSYTVKDNSGQVSNIATVSIDVTAVNDAPLANSQSVTTTEDTFKSITLTASDTENDPLTYFIVTQPANGSLSGTAPNLIYTPASNYNGSDSFTFKTNDGDADSVVATVTITITPVSDVPTADNQSLTTVESVPIALLLTGNDPDGSALTYTVVATSSKGSLTGSAPNLTYTPNTGYFGADSFSFKVNDGSIDSALATVSITVNQFNAAPVAVDDSIIMAVDTTRIISVLANDTDPENSTLTVVSASAASNGIVTLPGDGTVSYQPNTSYLGVDTFSYTIVDTAGFSDIALVTVEVVPGPTVTPPVDVAIDATALFTKVDLGTATAVDYLGNPLPVSLVDGVTFFWPGVNTAQWQATDENGLTGYATQIVNVRPLVSFSKDQTVAEGSTVTVKVVLNGPSPVYPVNVAYTVSGTAVNPADHDLINGIAIINSGTETTITLNIVTDGISESDETIVLTMSEPSLNQGVQNTHSIVISETNLAPSVNMNSVQNSLNRLTVGTGDGQVVVSTTVADPNVADTHTYDWSLSNNVLVDLDADTTTFTFDPSSLTEGVYEVWVNVTDDGVPALSTVARLYIEVVTTLPTLGTTDSDNDGIADNVEGFADADRDGIPDYLDSISECNVLTEQELAFKGYLVEVDPGVCARIGSYALLGESGGTQITVNDINASDTDDLVPDPETSNVGGVFDFIITELPDNGQSANIVIPQRQAIPVDGIYRKLKNGNWYTFVEDSNNKLWSAAGEQGYCPPPGSADYQPGLTAGHWCVQLTIEDGGPNDADGISNKMIIDPGGVGVMSISLTTRGGGGAIGLWELALLLIILLRLPRPLLRYMMLMVFVMLPLTAQAQGNAQSVDQFVNAPPVANNDNAATKTNTEIMIDVLSNDLDKDGDALIVINAQAEHGKVIIENKTTLRYIPAPDYQGKDTIEYVIYDGRGLIPKKLLDTIELSDSERCIAVGNCASADKEQVSLRLQITFGNNKTNVSSKYYPEIKKLADLLERAPKESVTIEGHTSAKGSARYNQKLSEKRAKAVADMLVSKFNISSKRIKSIGYGESRLINSEIIGEASAVNRRIEAVFNASFLKNIERKSGIASGSVSISVNNENVYLLAVDDKAKVYKNNSVDIAVLANDSIDTGEVKIKSATALNGIVTITDDKQLHYQPAKDFVGDETLHYKIEDASGSVAQANVAVSVIQKATTFWYAWADFGSASGSSSKSQLDSEFLAAGINATTTSLNNQRMSYQLGVGYQFNDSWSIEAGYVDLGEVEMSLTATTTNINQLYADVARIHPLSAQGYLVTGQYQKQLSDSIDLVARLGFWSWSSKYVTFNNVKVGGDSVSGSDLVMGLGASLKINESWKARLMWQRYAIKSEDVDAISLGMVYQY